VRAGLKTSVKKQIPSSSEFRSPAHSLAISACILLLASVRVSAQDAPVILDVTRTSENVVVSWTGAGILQSAHSVTGNWEDYFDATSPFAVPSSGQASGQFFRVINRWSKRAALIEANSEMGAAELDGLIYVLGGYPSTRITVGTVQVYDPVLDLWHLTTPLRQPVNHPMAASLNGRLYIIGGQTTASGSSSFVNSVFEYNPTTAIWTRRAPMPTSRSSGVAAVIDDLIYVVGGRPPRGQDFAVFDPGNNCWTALSNIPTARNHFAAAAIDGKVYVAGGRFGSGFRSEFTDLLEVYDPATRTWGSLAPMPTARSGANGIAANGWFHVFGGEGPEGVFAEHEVYDPSTDQWQSLEPIPVPIHGVTGAAFVDGWIHLPGGGVSIGGSSGSRIHQVYFAGTN